MKINFKKIGIGIVALIGLGIFIEILFPSPERIQKDTISAENEASEVENTVNAAPKEENIVNAVEPFIGKVMCTNPNQKAFQQEQTHTIDQEKVVISTIMLSEKGKKSPAITEGKIIESSKEKVSWSFTYPGEKYVGQVYKNEIDLKAGTKYTDFNFMSPEERDFRILEGNICKILN